MLRVTSLTNIRNADEIMNLVGYKLSGPDNDTHMFRKEDPIERCPVCGCRLDFLAYNPKYELRKMNLDFSATYDGFRIVSERFRRFCENQAYEDLVFGEFERDKAHYNFELKRVVKFDAVRRRTRFEELCPGCGNFKSIVGSKPSYLLISTPLEEGFYRSDLLFASCDEKHPLIFVSATTMAKLKDAKLSGLEFSPAYGL